MSEEKTPQWRAETLAERLMREWSCFVEPSHVWWTWRMLEALYSEPHRAYHNLTHVGACMDVWERMPGRHPIVKLALFFHDAVYVPGDKRNEELSAGLLRAIAPIPWAVHAGDWEQACLAILATQHHDAVVDDMVAG